MKLNDRHPLSYRILLVLAAVTEPVARSALADLLSDPSEFDATLDAMVARGVVLEPELGYYCLPLDEQERAA